MFEPTTSRGRRAPRPPPVQARPGFCRAGLLPGLAGLFLGLVAVLSGLGASSVGPAARPRADGSGPALIAAQPKGKIDCSKYTGTEKEACEKMMSRRRS